LMMAGVLSAVETAPTIAKRRPEPVEGPPGGG